MAEGKSTLVEQSDTAPGELTQEQILAAYERGPEAVLALFAQLQASAASDEQSLATGAPENVGQDGTLSPSLPDEFDEFIDEFINDSRGAPPTPADFDKLLAALAPDRQQAADRYQQIWQTLIRHFIRCRESDPEACADQVIEVLQRKIARGEEIRDVKQYSIAVAKKIRLKEWRRRRRLVDLPEGLAGSDPSLLEAAEKKAVIRCLVSCLQELPADKQKQFASYYLGKAQDKERREALAEEFGVSLNTLKVRVHRLAEALRGCMDQCLKKNTRNV